VAGLDKELDALRALDVEVEKQVRHSNALIIGNSCPACPGRSFLKKRFPGLQCMVCDNNDAAQADFDALEYVPCGRP
jgi:hypothetical protein